MSTEARINRLAYVVGELTGLLLSIEADPSAYQDFVKWFHDRGVNYQTLDDLTNALCHIKLAFYQENKCEPPQS